MNDRQSNRLVEHSLAASWFLLVVLGFGALLSYGGTPGSSGDSPESWPSDTTLTRVPGLPTLVMMAHPHCPCTRASISELGVLMSHCGGRLQAYVLFVDPVDDSSWVRSDLWTSASRIEGVQVVRDVGGAGAQLFGAATSGHVVLYDASGMLQFSGGVTAARGHAGDNVGRSTIVARARHEHGGPATTPVFGCPLVEQQKPTQIPVASE